MRREEEGRGTRRRGGPLSTLNRSQSACAQLSHALYPAPPPSPRQETAAWAFLLQGWVLGDRQDWWSCGKAESLGSPTPKADGALWRDRQFSQGVSAFPVEQGGELQSVHERAQHPFMSARCSESCISFGIAL